MLYEQQLSIAITYDSAPIIILILLYFLGVALHIAVVMAILICSVPDPDVLLLMVCFVLFRFFILMPVLLWLLN